MRYWSAWLLALFLSNLAAHGRGGGGCFERGTPILTPRGTIPIEQLKAGDEVISIIGGQSRRAVVAASFEVEPAEYFELSVAGRMIHVTAEHPFQIAPGVFRATEQLAIGETLWFWNGRELEPAIIAAIRRIPARHPAYNLLVSPGGTYLADGITVHNKGCFLPETPIMRADGSQLAISSVQPGETLLAFTGNGQIVTNTVQRVLIHQVEEYLFVTTELTEIKVTAEHPFFIGNGNFKTVEALRVGDTIFAHDGQRQWLPQRITRLQKIRAPTLVYNLQTDAPHTYFANGVAVHNKGGGCFPAGTPIHTPRGDIPIERLSTGELVYGVDANRQLTRTAVSVCYETLAQLLIIGTDAGPLRTTAEHPLLGGDGQFRPAEEFQIGETLTLWRKGRAIPATIRTLSTEPDLVPVYNLRVGEPHTFIASGFIVHNKGGGGFGGGGFSGGSGHIYSGSSSSSGPPMSSAEQAFILKIVFGVIGCILVCIVLNAIINRLFRDKEDEDLDYLYSARDVALKTGKTRKLLEFIARVDSDYDIEKITGVTTETFLQLQRCWQARDYEPMQPLLMPDLYQEHVEQLAGMIRNHEINMIAELAVKRVEIVNVRYPHKANEREFTALITATSRDYYIDDRTRETLRGDDGPATFQEFWTFQRSDSTWLLREIQQTRESDVLKEENFFEPFTDKGVQQVYQEEAGKEGPIGPWLEKATNTKADRIDRLLNFLVNTDKLWNRKTMLERARKVFMEVKLCWETMALPPEVAADLFPDLATDLTGEMGRQQALGTTYELRNLCVRKVELILVRNYADNTRDEFTVRISAHAQNAIRRNGNLIEKQEYVTPFEEYWTFGRLDNQWKLKEVLPKARGDAAVGEENVDEESSADQLQWYYRQSRAG